MQAKSLSGHTVEEIKKQLEKHIAGGFNPTLALAFVSIKQDRKAIIKLLDEAGIAIYGVTTHGEFTDEGISKEGVAILLLDLDPSLFKIYFEEFNQENNRESASKIARRALDRFNHPCFIIAASDLNTNAEELLHGFEDVIGMQANVYGGMAGDDLSFSKQYVFTNDWESNKGIVALAMNEDKLVIKGVSTCGWKPMGLERTVTKSEGNRVYTIDNVPILEMTKKFSGIKNVEQGNRSVMVELATLFPLQLQREKGDPVMRPANYVNWEDGSFNCSGTLPEGSKVRFSLPPDFDVIDKVIKSCENLKTEIQEADAVIVFSCAGRLISMGPMMSEELEGVKKVWEVPMAGMFSQAELGRATNGNLEMHNLTTCCIVIKER